MAIAARASTTYFIGRGSPTRSQELTGSSARRDSRDLDLVGRRREARLDGRAGRLVRLVDPLVPGAVHLRERPDVGEPDADRQQLRLVAAGSCEVGVDLGED